MRKMLVLLAGQSNMSGRGYLSEEDVKVIPGITALRRDGVWIPAIDPFNYDRINALGLNNSNDPFEEKAIDVNGKRRCGVGPGRTFGRLLKERFAEREIGLVPISIGGTPIASWMPGGKDPHSEMRPYDDGIQLARKAQDEGEFAVILWHQGETDAKLQTENYLEQLKYVINNFRRDLNIPDVPVILGGLGDFLDPSWQAEKYTAMIRQAAEELDNAGFVSAVGLQDRGDDLHFDTPSQYEFGKRYFEKFCELAGIK